MERFKITPRGKQHIRDLLDITAEQVTGTDSDDEWILEDLQNRGPQTEQQLIDFETRLATNDANRSKTQLDLLNVEGTVLPGDVRGALRRLFEATMIEVEDDRR